MGMTHLFPTDRIQKTLGHSEMFSLSRFELKCSAGNELVRSTEGDPSHSYHNLIRMPYRRSEAPEIVGKYIIPSQKHTDLPP